MTSTSVPAQKYTYSRDELLKLKDNSTAPSHERAILQKLKYFRLDKNSVLQILVKNNNTINTLTSTTPKTPVLTNLENTQVKKKPLQPIQPQQPQSAGPKLGRTTEQLGKPSITFDLSSKENRDPQLSTPSSFAKKPLLLQTLQPLQPLQPLPLLQPLSLLTPLKIKCSETSNVMLATPKSTPEIVITASEGPLPVQPSPNVFAVMQTPVKSSSTATNSPLPSSPSSASKCETDPHRLKQRQKQIDYGYRTIGYIKYTLEIAKDQRLKEHPKTPRKSQTCSKRSWDGQVKKWRRELHKYDPEDSNEFDKLMSDEILKFVYGETEEMPTIVTQLKEQIAEFMRTGTLGKLSDCSSDGLDGPDGPDGSDENTPLSTNDESLQPLRPDPQDNYRTMDFQKSPTVRMLVF